MPAVAARRSRRVLARPAHARACAARRPRAATRSPAGSTPSGCGSRTIRWRSSCSTAFGGGLAAPSANRFGRVSPTTAGARARRARRRRRRSCSTAGRAGRRRVDDRRLHRRSSPRVLRVGGVTVEALAAVLGGRARRSAGRLAAPGTLASHYAPAAPGSRSSTRDDARGTRARARATRGRRVGVHRGSRGSRAAACPPRTRDVRHARRRDGVRPRALRGAPRGRCSRARRRARGRRHRRAGIGLAVADRLGRAATAH